jgi:D-sedoheptulose 7-phosphate isomerase/D-glycero-D-manno-heptose 1,7-bisphosphate phosphatase
MAEGQPVRFPTAGARDAADYAAGYFAALREAMARIDLGQIAAAAKLLGQIYDRGGRVFAIGNGGSAAISDHLMCDHLKGIRTGTGRRPNVCSLASNSAMITAIGNDLSFEKIFVYQLESLAKTGDGLIAISSSGNSPNIVAALDWAKRNGVATIALTGFAGGKARDVADVSVYVPVANYGVSEDLHQSVMHILAQYLRLERLPPTTSLPQTMF